MRRTSTSTTGSCVNAAVVRRETRQSRARPCEWSSPALPASCAGPSRCICHAPMQFRNHLSERSFHRVRPCAASIRSHSWSKSQRWSSLLTDTPWMQMAPADPILGLSTAFKADTFPQKMNLGVGAYRGADGKPLVLNVVKKAEVHHHTRLLEPTLGPSSRHLGPARLPAAPQPPNACDNPRPTHCVIIALCGSLCVDHSPWRSLSHLAGRPPREGQVWPVQQGVPRHVWLR